MYVWHHHSKGGFPFLLVEFATVLVMFHNQSRFIEKKVIAEGSKIYNLG